MLKRSLACYMNAWTASDLTMYPFATTDLQDYRNLRDVYLDAVLRPLLRRVDFEQEGWRWDGGVIKGVVFNEMKGALSDPEDLFATRLQQSMLPGTVYSHSSGGEPLEIPRLSHEQLTAYWRRHYHPSNSCIVTFGTDPREDLEYLSGQLANYQREMPVDPADLSRGLQPFSEPRRMQMDGPDSGDIRMAISWLLPGLATNSQACFNWRMLSHLLIDGPHTPLHQRLIGAGVGREWSNCTGFDSHTYPHATFTVGLQAVSDDKVAHDAVIQAIASLADYQPPADLVEATLHQIEMSLRLHQSMQGLNLAQSCAHAWSHVQSLKATLSIDEKLNRFRHAWQEGKLMNMFVHSLTQQPHRLSLVMRPSSNFASGLRDAEVKLSEELKGFSASKPVERSDDSTKLPCLDPSSLERSIKPNPFSHGHVSWRQTAQANGVSYLRVILPLHLEMKPLHWLLLPSLCSLLTSLGQRGVELGKWEARMRMAGDGFSVSWHLNPLTGQLSLILCAHTLKWSEYLGLIGDTLQNPDWFNAELLTALIKQSAQSAQSDLASRGSSLAASMALSLAKGEGRTEWLDGLSQVQFLQQLAARAELSNLMRDFWHELSASIQSPRIAIISSNERQAAAVEAAEALVTRIQSSQKRSSLSMPAETLYDQIKTRAVEIGIPSLETNFTAMAVKTEMPYDPVRMAHLSLACSILQSPSLHEAIREQGGAYGVNLSYSPLNQSLLFTSYRDPNPHDTLRTYQTIQMKEDTGNALREAKLALMARLDKPMDVGWQFINTWMDERTDEHRQAYRHAILDAQMAQVKDALAEARAGPVTSVILGQQGQYTLFK